MTDAATDDGGGGGDDVGGGGVGGGTADVGVGGGVSLGVVAGDAADVNDFGVGFGFGVVGVGVRSGVGSERLEDASAVDAGNAVGREGLLGCCIIGLSSTELSKSDSDSSWTIDKSTSRGSSSGLLVVLMRRKMYI